MKLSRRLRRSSLLLTLLLLVWTARPISLMAQESPDQSPELAPTPAPKPAPALPAEEPERCLKEARAYGCRTIRVEAIVLEGLERTHRKVITREILFKEGGYASKRQLDESVTRLLNLGIFREVTYELITQRVPGDDVASQGKYPRRVVKLKFDERWTTLPAFKFAQGGGVTQFVVGLYDVNVLGRYLELGAQYDRLGYTDTFYNGDAANSYVVWFRDPRFLDKFLWVGADLWSVKRIRTLYDERGDAEGGFLLERLMLVLRLEHEIDRWLRAGVNLELMSDDFSYDFIPQERQDLQQRTFGKLPDSGKAFVFRGTAKFGRVNQDDYNYDGLLFTQSLAHSDTLWGADFRFTQLESELRWYKKLPWRSNLALRLGLGLGSTQQIQHLYYLGGLDRVRGFVDSRFRGSNYWSANAEYRIAPFASRWLVVQPTAFIDAATASDAPGELTHLDAASAGLGLRIISPKIYRFVMRFDYAFALKDNVDAAFSFGAQQFF